METPLQRIRTTDTRKLSQDDVARAVGMDQGYYSKVERGAVQPSPGMAEKLAKFFGNRISEVEILYPERFQNPVANPAEPGKAA